MHHPDLSTHTVLITGATSGFGEATARILVKHGARVVICGRRVERLQKLQAELGALCHYHALDVRNNEEISAFIQNLPAEFTDISALINNAGLALGTEAAQNCMINDWETMIDTNIKGVMYCTKAVLPHMINRHDGYIINIGSVAGTYPYPGGNIYGGTKAFLRQFSLNLRSDLLGTGVRVTNIEPGIAETEFSNVRFKGDDFKADAVYQNVSPLSAEDIAQTILWCLSRPKHVNINSMEIMPTCQAFGPFYINRS